MAWESPVQRAVLAVRLSPMGESEEIKECVHADTRQAGPAATAPGGALDRQTGAATTCRAGDGVRTRAVSSAVASLAPARLAGRAADRAGVSPAPQADGRDMATWSVRRLGCRPLTCSSRLMRRCSRG